MTKKNTATVAVLLLLKSALETNAANKHKDYCEERIEVTKDMIVTNNINPVSIGIHELRIFVSRLSTSSIVFPCAVFIVTGELLKGLENNDSIISTNATKITQEASIYLKLLFKYNKL